MTQLLNLSLLRIDGGTQSRVAIHEATVAEYTEVLEAGDALPPVDVYFDGTDHWLADGFHRYFANQRIGAVSIDAEVHAGTRTDALMHAFGANKAHGLRRTNEDKRKAVEGMLALAPQWSDRAIAKHVGVGHTMVATLRNPAKAQAQAESRAKSAAKKPAGQRKVASDATQVVTGMASDATSRATETASPVTPEQRAPGPVTTAEVEDALGDFDPHDECKRMQAELDAAHALLKAAEADDLKAEAMKWRRAYDHAQREQSVAMDRYHNEAKLHKFKHRQLMRCGKAVGEEDPDKVAAAVEAFVRMHKVAA